MYFFKSKKSVKTPEEISNDYEITPDEHESASENNEITPDKDDAALENNETKKNTYIIMSCCHETLNINELYNRTLCPSCNTKFKFFVSVADDDTTSAIEPEYVTGSLLEIIVKQCRTQPYIAALIGIYSLVIIYNQVCTEHCL